MKFDKEALRLYAVTDRTWLGETEPLTEGLEQAILGGVTMVQLREKTLAPDLFRKEACEVKKLCDKYGVPLIVNDNVEIAAAVDAFGVHVGQSDWTVAAARKRLGETKVIGVSVHTVAEAVLAQEQGADYLGVGAVFPTGSKADAAVLGCERVRQICQSVSIPVVAIGGIGKETIGALKESGISGIAVISAIFAKPDKKAAAQELKDCVDAILAEAEKSESYGRK